MAKVVWLPNETDYSYCEFCGAKYSLLLYEAVAYAIQKNKALTARSRLGRHITTAYTICIY